MQTVDETNQVPRCRASWPPRCIWWWECWRCVHPSLPSTRQFPVLGPDCRSSSAPPASPRGPPFHPCGCLQSVVWSGTTLIYNLHSTGYVQTSYVVGNSSELWINIPHTWGSMCYWVWSLKVMHFTQICRSLYFLLHLHHQTSTTTSTSQTSTNLRIWKASL